MFYAVHVKLIVEHVRISAHVLVVTILITGAFTGLVTQSSRGREVLSWAAYPVARKASPLRDFRNTLDVV